MEELDHRGVPRPGALEVLRGRLRRGRPRGQVCMFSITEGGYPLCPQEPGIPDTVPAACRLTVWW